MHYVIKDNAMNQITVKEANLAHECFYTKYSGIYIKNIGSKLQIKKLLKENNNLDKYDKVQLIKNIMLNNSSEAEKEKCHICKS